MARLGVLVALGSGLAGLAVACNNTQVAKEDCPDGAVWSSSTGKCYFKMMLDASFDECAQSCGRRSATLAGIPSKEVNSLLFDMLDDGQWAWIGLYQTPKATTSTSGWENWMNGCSYDDYENWYEKPDDWCGLNEMCAFMKSGSEDGWDMGDGWQDAQCQSQFACLCEWPSSASAEYEEVAKDLLDVGDLSDECKEAALMALGMGLIIPILCCCCFCCCACGCGYFFYKRSQDQRRQREMAAQQQQGQIGSTVLGQPVTGTIVVK